VYAQSLVEYGALANVSSTVRQMIESVENWAADATLTTWLIVGAVVVVGFALWKRL
jgi:hypothetical protein